MTGAQANTRSQQMTPITPEMYQAMMRGQGPTAGFQAGDRPDFMGPMAPSAPQPPRPAPQFTTSWPQPQTYAEAAADNAATHQHYMQARAAANPEVRARQELEFGRTGVNEMGDTMAR